MRLAIVGSRVFHDTDVFDFYINKIMSEYELTPTLIVSGAASGTDTLAAQFAKNNDIELLEFPVTKEDWERIGRGAGMARNTKIVESCDVLIAFCVELSKGTMDSVKKSISSGKKTFVIDLTDTKHGIKPVEMLFYDSPLKLF